MSRPLRSLFVVAVAVSAACGASPAAPSTPNPGLGSVGTHTVSLSVSDACPAIAPAARQRTYTATIANGLVTLTSGTFLHGLICTFETGLDCNQFRLTQDGDTASIVLDGGEWHGGEIVEQLEDGTWIEVTARGTGRVEGSTIQAVLEGVIWYCPIASSYPFPCKTFKVCQTENMQMTIVKKNATVPSPSSAGSR